LPRVIFRVEFADGIAQDRKGKAAPPDRFRR
jgi:hypothetical protein